LLVDAAQGGSSTELKEAHLCDQQEVKVASATPSTETELKEAAVAAAAAGKIKLEGSVLAHTGAKDGGDDLQLPGDLNRQDGCVGDTRAAARKQVEVAS
jgi:hypothetical protein